MIDSTQLFLCNLKLLVLKFSLQYQYHPDKYNADNLCYPKEIACEHFHKLNEAWKTLGNIRSRTKYDERLRGICVDNLNKNKLDKAM